MKKNLGESGFSIVEIMVALGILGILFSLAADKIRFGDQEIHSLHNKLKARHLLNRAMADIVASSAHYPPRSMGSQTMSYVGCFNKEGVLLKNNLGMSGYWLENLPNSDCSSNAKPAPSNRCSLDSTFGSSAFEMQIRPAINGERKASLSILTYDFSTKNFLTLYCGVIRTESSL